MNNTLFRRTVIVWLLVCLISGVLLYAEQIRRQFWERDREFSTRYSTLSAVLTQNESVLPLLNGEEAKNSRTSSPLRKLQAVR